MVIYYNWVECFDVIINNVNIYLKSYFYDLCQIIDGLQLLVDQFCENIDFGFIFYVVFSFNVCVFLLVKNGIVFCLLVMGVMNMFFSQLILVIDISKFVVMVILSGMLMMLKSVVLVLWVGKFGD